LAKARLYPPRKEGFSLLLNICLTYLASDNFKSKNSRIAYSPVVISIVQNRSHLASKGFATHKFNNIHWEQRGLDIEGAFTTPYTM